MNHLSAILNAYNNTIAIGTTTFLITIVQTEGSTYRKSGARMLVTHPGDMIGMVSGGCLEQDILCHVQQQRSPYRPFLITYDTHTAEDIVWGFGLGCDGVVRVLVEPLHRNCPHNPLTFITQCFDRQQSGVLATIFQVEGQGSVSLGDRLRLDSDASIESTIKDSDLYQTIAIDAQTALDQKTTLHRQYSFPWGQVTAILEVITPPHHLVIFGAGRDALPLAQFAKALGWQLTLVDVRSLTTTRDRFPMADHIHLTNRDRIHEPIHQMKNPIAVVMTHNYLDDVEILHQLLKLSAPYIGVLGSRQRTERLLEELQLKMDHDGINQSHRLHAPIGLDIGAETPEEIAIAIIAEIQAATTDRPAEFLKHRLSAIHLPQRPLLHAL